MCHRHIPFVAFMLATLLSVAADKKAKEPVLSDAQIQLWVKQLGDDDFKLREESTRNLIKAGKVAFDAVTKATKSEDSEVKQRALRIFNHPEKVAKEAKQKAKAAIAYFKKLGGKVTVDEKSPGKPVIELKLWYSNVTDAGLVHLKWLTELQKLKLSNTKVTDAGLVYLKGLTKLRDLWLEETKVTDAGLVHLKGLTKLQELNLEGTKITDVGLVHLKGLKELQRLNLGNTDVTDAGLVYLKGLTKLRDLWLEETKVTDAGLVHLKGITKLKKLNLEGTKITDAGLVHLKGLTSLEFLNLIGTKTTKAGILNFLKEVPKCFITKRRAEE